MKPPRFEYHAPASIEEILGLLAALGDEAKVLAGGQSLIPMLNFRLVRPGHVIDINRAVELDYVQRDDGALVLGALVRHHRLENDPLVRSAAPLVSEAARHIGHLAIRTRGTVGGSLAHADPAAELGCVLTTLDARFVVRSRRGDRLLAPDAFFAGYLTTTLEPDELLVEVRVPDSGGCRWGFSEFSRRHGDFALAAAAVVLDVDDGGRCRGPRVVLAGVGGTPVRVRALEEALDGQPLSNDILRPVRQLVEQSIDPEGDMHASPEFRRHLACVVAERAVRQAVGIAARES